MSIYITKKELAILEAVIVKLYQVDRTAYKEDIDNLLALVNRAEAFRERQKKRYKERVFGVKMSK